MGGETLSAEESDSLGDLVALGRGAGLSGADQVRAVGLDGPGGGAGGCRWAVKLHSWPILGGLLGSAPEPGRESQGRDWPGQPRQGVLGHPPQRGPLVRRPAGRGSLRRALQAHAPCGGRRRDHRGAPGRAGQAPHLRQRERAGGHVADDEVQGCARRPAGRLRRDGPAGREHQAAGTRRLGRAQRHEVDHRRHRYAGVRRGSGSAWAGRPGAATRSGTCSGPCPGRSRARVDDAVSRAADAIEAALRDGVVEAMNRFNVNPPAWSPSRR